MSQYNNAQQNFVQEVRLQSTGDGKLSWVAGIFYSDLEQEASQPINHNWMINATWMGFYPTAFDFGYWTEDGGVPFGPGSTALQNFFGDNPLETPSCSTANGPPRKSRSRALRSSTRPHRHLDADRRHPGEREQARFQRRLPGAGKQRQRSLRLSLCRPGRLHVWQRRVGALVPDFVLERERDGLHAEVRYFLGAERRAYDLCDRCQGVPAGRRFAARAGDLRL